MQPQFVYDVHIVAAIRDSVSSARLQRYEVLATGNAAQALRLYMWNSALSEALYGPIQGLEITLRNKMNDRFAGQFGPHWYDAPGMGLLYAQRNQLTHARESLASGAATCGPCSSTHLRRFCGKMPTGFSMTYGSCEIALHITSPYCTGHSHRNTAWY